MENGEHTENRKAIIVFDGVCNLCNWSVDFILRHDKRHIFYFADKDGETAKNLKRLASLQDNITEETILLFQGNTHYIKSRAVLKILKELGQPWSLLYVFVLIPAPLRDLFYDIVNKSRFTLFGRGHICRIMSKELGSRFL
ncbi:MAG: DCC1-like thiol-disulfide oxidoreductase family protein [bacterium]|nr:DCC1-like thiol-disulfide oxidoreductase family protein [bacterium]